MKRTLLYAVLVCAAAAPILSQKNPFLGRWDLTITPQSGSPYPGWIELTDKDGKLEGRYQPRGGAWRNLAAAKVDNGHLVATIQAAGRGPEVTWDFTAAGEKLTGVEKRGDAAGPSIAGVRAPELKK